MAARTETIAAVRPVPYLLGQVAQTVTCPVRHGSTGALQTPSSGTLTVKRPDGTSFLSAGVVTVSNSVATYDLASLAAEDVGQGWVLEWSLVISSVTYTFRYDAYVCAYIPHNSISVQDLYTYEPELRHRVPQGQSTRGDDTGWQPQVDDAYYALIQWLLDGGHRPWLIVGMTGTREWLRTLALMRCCRALSTTTEDQWTKKTTDYRYEHKDASAKLVVQYSTDLSGTRRGVASVVRLAPVGRPVC